MHPAWRVSLPEDVAVRVVPDGSVVLDGPGGRLRWTGLDPAACDALRKLAFPGTRLGPWLVADGSAASSSRVARLRRLAQKGLLWIAVDGGSHAAPLATLLASVSDSPLRDVSWDVRTQRFVLSRFACQRRRGDFAIAESPLSDARVVLHDPAVAAVLHRAARPLALDEIGSLRPGLPEASVLPLLELLAAAMLIVPVGPDGTSTEDAHPQQRYWEFHDLLFHSHSRSRRHGDPFGGTFLWAGFADPPLAVAPLPSGARVVLPSVDMSALRASDPPLADVVERRRTIREYGASPLTVAQLGEFLYRVARVVEERRVVLESPGGPIGFDTATRPYPSGGGLYELDLHVLAQRCAGLDGGLFRYDAVGHALVRHAAAPADVERLARDAAEGAGIEPGTMQVLVVISARLPRLAWKYSSIAYALILKHVGVVMQSMYLAATATGLAPCAVGTGDSELFARALGADPFGETSVGEFLLGSRRDM